MPTKTNSNGEQQKYIPAGNGDKSGEFTNDKSIDQIKSDLGYKEEIRKDNSELVDYVDMTKPNELQSTIQAYCDWLAEEPVEHSIIIDKNGNVWHTKGNEYRVEPSEKIDLDGAIDIHNHIDPHGFSNEDFPSIFRHKETTFMLVDKDYMYSVRALKNPDRDYNHYYNTGLFNAIEDGFDYQSQEHYAMLEMQKEGLVEYDRRPRKGIDRAN